MKLEANQLKDSEVRMLPHEHTAVSSKFPELPHLQHEHAVSQTHLLKVFKYLGYGLLMRPISLLWQSKPPFKHNVGEFKAINEIYSRGRSIGWSN